MLSSSLVRETRSARVIGRDRGLWPWLIEGHSQPKLNSNSPPQWPHINVVFAVTRPITIDQGGAGAPCLCRVDPSHGSAHGRVEELLSSQALDRLDKHV